MIELPPRPGQLIVDEVAMRLRPLRARKEFVKFCRDRNLNVTQKLLHRLEELRVFAPVIRVAKAPGDRRRLHVDGESTAADFAEGWVEDCSAPDADYPVPEINDPGSMPFYSEFQVWALERVLRDTSVTLTLDEFAGPDADLADWNRRFDRIRQRALERVAEHRSNAVLTAIPILCQLISNRYLPHALSNQRSYPVGGVSHFGEWMVFGRGPWDWGEYCEDWDAAERVQDFALDAQSLERVHWRLVSAMHGCDPLWQWRNLIQFVNQPKRNELKGDGLRAELYRQCAEMIRRLYRDLYQTDLGPPEDALHGAPSWIPEAEVRDDPREHLQFVANQYDLNPQPTASLFVEGESEVVFVEAIFRGLFGAHHGVSGIEILNLHGVDNATGNRRSDQYNAIFRLVDYLLEHQTLVFLILDNEGQAGNLKSAAATKRSVFGSRARAIAPDRIHVWERNFELDNFEDAELARALTAQADRAMELAAAEIAELRAVGTDSNLSRLFTQRTGRGLNKPALAAGLAEIAVEAPQRSDGSDRPIIEFLLRVRREAARNPLPLTRGIWRENQEFLDAEVGDP